MEIQNSKWINKYYLEIITVDVLVMCFLDAFVYNAYRITLTFMYIYNIQCTVLNDFCILFNNHKNTVGQEILFSPQKRTQILDKQNYPDYIVGTQESDSKTCN